MRDNGRGIPVDPHPKFKHLSALEVILTTLHSGGKFGGKVYETSGGLHGVGASVVNALSEVLEVEVARDRVLWRQRYVRGKPTTKLVNAGPVHNRRGTTIRFQPDRQIFGELQFSPARLYRLCRSKAYLFRGVEIRWTCDPALLQGARTRRQPKRCCTFPGGLRDSLEEDIGGAVAASCRSGRARPTCPPATAHAAAWNGRSPGSRRARASCTPTATPCRRRRAARTRPDSATRC